MARYDHQNVVLGPCRIGKIDGRGTLIAQINAAASSGASTIVLTGTTLGVEVGDPVYVDDGTKSTLIATLAENGVLGEKTVEITGKTLGIEAGDTIYLDDTANAHHEFGYVISAVEGVTNTTVTLREALGYAFASATSSAYEVTGPLHEIVIATLVTEAATTTLTLLHKLVNALSTEAIAYTGARTLWGLTEVDSLTFSEDMEITEIFADQVKGPVKRELTNVTRTLAANFEEIVPENIKDFRALSSKVIGTWPEQTLIVAYAADVPELVVSITGPAPKGAFFRYTCLARVNDSGDVVRGKTTAVVMPVTFGEIVNADTNEFAVFAWSATDFA